MTSAIIMNGKLFYYQLEIGELDAHISTERVSRQHGEDEENVKLCTTLRIQSHISEGCSCLLISNQAFLVLHLS